MGKFTGIENAAVSERLPYIAANSKYLFEVEALKMIESRSHGDMYVSEFTVLESEGCGANPPGTSCSNLIKLKMDSALGNIKSQIAAITRTPAKSVTTAMADRAVSDSNPLKGELVRAESFLVKTKKNTDFTKIVWRPATTADLARYGVETSTAAPIKGATTVTPTPTPTPTPPPAQKRVG